MKSHKKTHIMTQNVDGQPIIPTKQFKNKPHAIMWIDDFLDKYPSKTFTIIRRADRVSTYIVGELDHLSDTHFVFADGMMAKRDLWIKSFIH